MEPLPKRIRKREKVENNIRNTDSINDIIEIDKQSHNKQQQTLQNVADRSLVHRISTTLESKDGCAGDGFEYLDHTADVQFHVWADDIELAFANMSKCMINYLTDANTVTIDPLCTTDIKVTGHDLQTLLYAYMDELLFRFSTDGFCCKEIEIKRFSRETFEFEFTAYGETFNPRKHPQGTEIKAITYSAMQIHEKEDRTDLYVIVDI